VEDIDWHEATDTDRSVHVLKQCLLYLSGDPDVGSAELDDLVANELAHLMGDSLFQQWVEDQWR
jgi:hypothetical protein